MIDCIVIENHRTQSRVIGSSSYFLLSYLSRPTFLSFFPRSFAKNAALEFSDISLLDLELLWFQSVIGGAPIMRGLDALLPLPPPQVGGGPPQHRLLPLLLLLLLHLSATTAQFCTGTETFEKVEMRFMTLLDLWHF